MAIKVGDLLPFDLDSLDWLSDRANVQGRPFILYFWSKSYHFCHVNMPDLHRLRDEFAEQGLRVVAIHRPMNDSDMNVEIVKDKLTELSITEPCALDNDHSIGDALSVSAWPTYFLFDSEGKLRRHARGNFGVKMIEQILPRFVAPKSLPHESQIEPSSFI